MKVMANKANLLGKETNHSARKSTCTRLLHAGIAPTTIQQLTGHKNVQSINNYAIASIEMQKNMSDILTNKDKELEISTHRPPAGPAKSAIKFKFKHADR